MEFFRRTSLSLPEVMEQPHYEKASFCVRKRIFATFDVRSNRACVKLSETNQNVFSSVEKSGIFPDHGKWIKQGRTYISIGIISRELFKDAVNKAYETVAKKNSINA